MTTDEDRVLRGVWREIMSRLIHLFLRFSSTTFTVKTVDSMSINIVKNDKSAMNNRDGTKKFPFVQIEHINKGSLITMTLQNFNRSKTQKTKNTTKTVTRGNMFEGNGRLHFLT